MIEELNSFLNILKDVNNPFYMLLLFTLFLGVAVFFIFKNIVIPKNKSHQKEKDALLALFAQLDPDPLIRFDRNGTVIISNESACKVFRTVLKGADIRTLIKGIYASPAEMIDKKLSFSFTEHIHDKSFLITVKPIPTLNAGQLYFKDITENLKSENRLLEYQERLKEYNENLESFMENEKFRIAQDLHDSIGQKLLLLKMRMQKYLEPRGYAESELDVSLEETIGELRQIIYNLKPKMLEELGLPAALNALTQKITTESGISGKFESVGFTERLNNKTELFLFRIAQEALNNVVKHSEATVFNIQLINTPRSIKLIVSDNGKGFNSENLFCSSVKTNGFGLFNIKEKVEKHFGVLRVNSSVGEGTVLLVQLKKGMSDGK